MSFLKYCTVICFSTLFLAGCYLSQGSVQGPYKPRQEAEYHKPGPPPHAPAHGYRQKNQHGHEMEYNEQAGAYVVLHVPETYFGNNLYIRVAADGTWLVSATLESGWRVALGHEIPPTLISYKKKEKDKNHKNKKDKKHKGKGDN